MLLFDEFSDPVQAERSRTIALLSARIANQLGIFELVDAYVTMTTSRPHLPCLSSDDALWELLGDQRYAPELVDALVEVAGDRRVLHRDVA